MGAEGQLLVPEEGIRTRRRRLDWDTEGRTPRLKYEPKEGTYVNRRKREGAHLATNRRKKQRHKTHSDFTQVRGPRER